MGNDKITSLLGAGASIPFINFQGECLTSKYLTDALFDRDKWKGILSKFNHYRSERYDSDSYPDNIDTNDILFVVDRINEHLRTNQRFGENFEYIIHLLDKVADYLSSFRPSESENIDEILIDFWQSSDPTVKQNAYRNSDKDGWRYVPFLARELLISTILCLWNDSNPAIQKGIKTNSKFFKTLLDGFKSVNIYSLNYDPLIYESLKNINAFSTGFDRNNIFQSNDFFQADNVIAFVHGQVGFEPFSNQMRSNDNYFAAQGNRMKGVFDSTTNSTRYLSLGIKGVHYNT